MDSARSTHFNSNGAFFFQFRAGQTVWPFPFRLVLPELGIFFQHTPGYGMAVGRHSRTSASGAGCVAANQADRIRSNSALRTSLAGLPCQVDEVRLLQG